MSEMTDDIAYLSQEIGPRPAGTEEEQQASHYIANRFRKSAGLRAEIVEFNCDPEPGLIEAVCFGISVLITLIGVLFGQASMVAFLVTLIVAVLYAFEFFDKPILSRMTSRGVSQNVIATYNPGQAAANRRRKIILVANYDSGKVRNELSKGFMGFYPLAQKASHVSLIALPLVWLIRVAASGVQGGGLIVFNVILILLAVCAALPTVFYLLARSATYNEAANDNASGVAVLLELARRINVNAVVSSEETIPEERERGDVSEANQEPVIHGAEMAVEAEAVPEGAELVYDDDVAPTKADMEINEIDENQSNASGALPVSEADRVGEKHNDNPLSIPEADMNNEPTEQGSGILVEQAENPDVLKQDSDAEIVRAKSEAVAAERQRRRDAAPVPEWYRIAQEKAHKPASDKPVKRSRYADALDQAVAESSHYFAEAAMAVDRETTQYLDVFDRGIKPVSAPADAATRGSASPKNPSSADMMRAAKEKAEATARKRARLEAEEDAIQEQVDMEQQAIARAAERNSEKETPVASDDETGQEKIVSRETIAFIDNADGEDSVLTAVDVDPGYENGSDDNVIDEVPVSVQSEYLDGFNANVDEGDANQSDQLPKEPETIDVKGLRSEVVARREMENDPVQRLQKKPTVNRQEAPQREAERIVYDETDETSLPYYDESDSERPLEGVRERIESGYEGLRNRVKKWHLPKFNRDHHANDFVVDDEYDAYNDDRNWLEMSEEDKQKLNEDTETIRVSSAGDDADGVPETAHSFSTSDVGDTDANDGTIPIAQRKAAQTNGDNMTSTAQVQVTQTTAQKNDPNATIGIAPIHIDAAPSRVRNLDIPKVQSTAEIQPIVDQVKQRAPLADAAESGSETTAKTLLSARIPRIDASGAVVSNDKIEMDNKKAALRNTLPSMSGTITAMTPPEESNSVVSNTGSFNTSAGTTGSFAPVGDELVADLPPEERYVDDADDSSYQVNATETGAFAGPGYMQMPAKHRGLFGRRKKGKKRKETEQSAAEWLDVDENFNPTEVGAQRGGWESFQQDSEYERKQRKNGTQVSRAKSVNSNDREYEDWDDEGNWSDEWNGGAFSRSRAESHTSRTGRRRKNNDNENEQQERRRPTAALPPEFADVARIADRMAVEDGSTVDQRDEEMQAAYEFRNAGINCEVWFVALGAANANNAGMKAFLDAYRQELKGSVVINLEALGAGDLSYTDSEGKILVKRASTRVKRYLRMASQASGINMKKTTIDWRESAASEAIAHGLQAVSVVGIENGKPALMAQGDDVLENISDESLTDAADYVIEVLKNI